MESSPEVGIGIRVETFAAVPPPSTSCLTHSSALSQPMERLHLVHMKHGGSAFHTAILTTLPSNTSPSIQRFSPATGATASPKYSHRGAHSSTPARLHLRQCRSTASRPPGKTCLACSPLLSSLDVLILSPLYHFFSNLCLSSRVVERPHFPCFFFSCCSIKIPALLLQRCDISSCSLFNS